MGKKRIKKRALELDMLGWLLLGLAVLILVIVIIAILSGKASSAIDFIRNLFRFRTS